jgi:hypothetical protein
MRWVNPWSRRRLEVVALATLRKVLHRLAQQLRQVRAELAVGKTGGQQIEHQNGIPECLHGGISERSADTRSPSTIRGR